MEFILEMAGKNSFIDRFCTIVQYIKYKSNIDIYSILKRPKLNGKIF